MSADNALKRSSNWRAWHSLHRRARYSCHFRFDHRQFLQVIDAQRLARLQARSAAARLCRARGRIARAVGDVILALGVVGSQLVEGDEQIVRQSNT